MTYVMMVDGTVLQPTDVYKDGEDVLFTVDNKRYKYSLNGVYMEGIELPDDKIITIPLSNFLKEGNGE